MNYSDPFLQKKIISVLGSIYDDLAELFQETNYLTAENIFKKSPEEYKKKWESLRTSEKRDFRDVVRELESLRESISDLRDDIENTFNEVDNSVNRSFESTSEEE